MCEDREVSFQVNPGRVVVFVPEVVGSEERLFRWTAKTAGSVRAVLEDQGLRLGDFVLREGEFAFPRHPVAVAWREEMGENEGVLWGAGGERRLWVDCSRGEPELETKRLVIARAVQRLGWTDVTGRAFVDLLKDALRGLPEDCESLEECRL